MKELCLALGLLASEKRVLRNKFVQIALVFSLINFCGFGMVMAEGSPNDKFGYGKSHLGLQLGYGLGMSLGFVGWGDGSQVSYMAAFPSYGIGISDIFADEDWYRGNVDLVVQGEFIKNFQPSDGYSLGGGFLFRYNFLANKKFIPYLELGLGFGSLNFGLDDQIDGFVFSPQGGVGAYYFISDHIAINAAWKLHHMSNSGIEQPNNSVNASVFLLGVNYFFD